MMKFKPTSKQRKIGAVAGNMDWPLMYYTTSLSRRIGLVAYYHDQIILDNANAVEEVIEGRKKEIGTSYTQHHFPMLVNNFEIFCDQIYKAMENIANVNLFVLKSRGKGKVSNKFFQQRKSIREGTHSFGEKYDAIVKDLGWLDELRNIRDISNHYLQGFGVYRWEGDQPVLQYHTYPILSGMESSTEPVQVDILSKTEEYYLAFKKCIDDVGSCYIDQLDPDAKCLIPYTGFDKKIQFVSVSMSELVSGNIPI